MTVGTRQDRLRLVSIYFAKVQVCQAPRDRFEKEEDVFDMMKSIAEDFCKGRLQRNELYKARDERAAKKGVSMRSRLTTKKRPAAETGDATPPEAARTGTAPRPEEAQRAALPPEGASAPIPSPRNPPPPTTSPPEPPLSRRRQSTRKPPPDGQERHLTRWMEPIPESIFDLLC